MDELRDLVALSVPTGSRVLAIAPDAPLVESLVERDCQTWSVVTHDNHTLPLQALSEGVLVGDLDQVDLAEAFGSPDFDVVVLMGTLAHILFPAELLRRLMKVLAADGLVVASVPNATHALRRLRFWRGAGNDEEVSPGRPLLRAFNAQGVQQLLSESGLSTVQKLLVRRPPTEPTLQRAWPSAVLEFLAADEDADVDHYVLVASCETSAQAPPPSLGEELQRRLHHSQDELAVRNVQLADLEQEMEALQLDLAVKDDYALELRRQIQNADARAATMEAELIDARVSLQSARNQLTKQASEIEELRSRVTRGLASLLLDRIGQRFAAGPPPPPTPP